MHPTTWWRSGEHRAVPSRFRALNSFPIWSSKFHLYGPVESRRYFEPKWTILRKQTILTLTKSRRFWSKQTILHYFFTCESSEKKSVFCNLISNKTYLSQVQINSTFKIKLSKLHCTDEQKMGHFDCGNLPMCYSELICINKKLQYKLKLRKWINQHNLA